MDDLIKDIFDNDEGEKKNDGKAPIFENTDAPVIIDDVVSEVYEAHEPIEQPITSELTPPEKPDEPADVSEFEPKAESEDNLTEMLNEDKKPAYVSQEPVQSAPYVAPSAPPVNFSQGAAPEPVAPSYAAPNAGYVQSPDRTVFYQPPVQRVAPPVNNMNNYSVPPAFNQNAQGQYSAPNELSPAGTVMPPQKKKNKNTVRIIIAIIAIFAVAASFSGIAYAIKHSDSTSSSSNDLFEDFRKDDEKENDNSNDAEAEVKSSEETAKKKTNGELTVTGVVEQTKASCVGITVYAKQDDFSYFYNFGMEGNNEGGEVKSGEGSGVIMSESDGKTYIMTCAHVIADGTRYTVTLDDDKEYEARFVGSDAQTDIGVLVIDAKGLQVAEFGDSKDIEIGEDCVVIGCPGGLDFKNSVTKGIVSALDVPIESTIGYNNECIQVDAAINPGNSGGALFNMQGQVIGINSSKIASTEYEGMGFAVPSNTAVNTANSLIKNGYVKGRAKIGVTYATFSMLQNGGSQILAALEEKGFKDAQGTMIISEVSEDSDLKGKVEKNDMIVAVNGKTMTSVDVLTSVLAKSKPGDEIKLTIARIDGNDIKTFDVKCKLIESKQ